jgi:hypothetical protein
MPGQPSSAGSRIGLDAMSGRATQTARTTYLALLTAAPTDATTLATMTEVTTPASNGYNRLAVTWSDPAATEVSSNTAVLSFGPLTADLGNVTHCALVSALTGTTGDFIYWWALDTARDPAINDRIEFAIGALSMGLE